MTLADILAELSRRHGRAVRAADYPSLRAMLEELWNG